MDESRVKFGSDTFEQHAKEILVGLQNSLPYGKSLHVAHTVGRAQCRHHRVGHGDGSLVSILQRHELANLNVAAEAHHFVANRVFEAKTTLTDTIITARPMATPAVAMRIAGFDTMRCPSFLL